MARYAASTCTHVHDSTMTTCYNYSEFYDFVSSYKHSQSRYLHSSSDRDESAEQMSEVQGPVSAFVSLQHRRQSSIVSI